MEALAWLGVLFVLGLAAVLFFVIRRHVLKVRKEKQEQAEREAEKAKKKAEEEAAFIERLRSFYHGRIKKLPVTEVTVSWWWYQRLGLFGPWKRFDRKKTFLPTENQIIDAAYHYLKAVEAGEVRDRNFSVQSELWVFVHENVKSLVNLTPTYY